MLRASLMIRDDEGDMRFTVGDLARFTAQAITLVMREAPIIGVIANERYFHEQQKEVRQVEAASKRRRA